MISCKCLVHSPSVAEYETDAWAMKEQVAVLAGSHGVMVSLSLMLLSFDDRWAS
jgi:hypothetical protein